MTSDGIDSFIKDKPSVPKLILFTDKKGIPTLFKALGNSMDGKMYLAIARAEDEALAKKYKITAYPTIIIVKSAEKAHHVYKGDIVYKPIFDWANIYAETFVAGGESESVSTKPWMSETVPELHRLSADDICMKADNLCVIYLGAAKPEDPFHSTLKAISKKLLN
jgi:hypothetical protein